MTLITLNGKLGNYQFNPRGFFFEGGTGKVYKGKVLASFSPLLQVNQSVAVKVLFREFTENVVQVIRAQDAANIQVDHPNLLRMYEFIENKREQIFHSISEWLDGVTLDKRIQQSNQNNQPIPLEEQERIIYSILDGLECLHTQVSPIYHRDIKPDNIMLTSSGLVKIMDYGIAKVAHSKKKTSVGAVLGSLQYAPPEQIQGSHDQINASSDLYALGNTMFELFCGLPPFKGSHFELMNAQVNEPIKLCEAIPEHFQAFILKATRKSQIKRFQSVQEARSFLLNPENDQISSENTFSLQESIGTIFWAFLLIGVLICGYFIYDIVNEKGRSNQKIISSRKQVQDLIDKGDDQLGIKKFSKACELYKQAKKLSIDSEINSDDLKAEIEHRINKACSKKEK